MIFVKVIFYWVVKEHLLFQFFIEQFFQKKKNILVINIGGISNFTFLNGKKTFFASDIGPGNTLIDEFCYKNFKKIYDFNGNLAKKGKIKFELIDLWLKNKIFF